jgi:hypothetical protein
MNVNHYISLLQPTHAKNVVVAATHIRLVELQQNAPQTFSAPFGESILFCSWHQFLSVFALWTLFLRILWRCHKPSTSSFNGNESLTHWRWTPSPTCMLHRLPLHNCALPEHATTLLRDWIIRFSPAEGPDGDPRCLVRRVIGAELANQLLLLIDKPTLTIMGP